MDKSEDLPNRYDLLSEMYKWSQLVCNPLEYAHRQQNLLIEVVEYLLQRDRPTEKEDHDS